MPADPSRLIRSAVDLVVFIARAPADEGPGRVISELLDLTHAKGGAS
jgi:hypothetical protein